ncbi:MAG: hypothetical protein LBF69_05245 [Prevotellaceae bacterium]|jgi:hypothetical protein|nr:hypothetical protein [Prevotellaceae bacterium]
METKLPNLNSRVKEIIENLDNGNVAKFAKRLENVSQQRLNRIFNVDTRTNKYPGVPDDLLIDIAASIPDISLDWLLTGKGEMLKINQKVGDVKNSKIVNSHINNYQINSELIDTLKEQLNKKDKEIDRLWSLIEKINK